MAAPFDEVWDDDQSLLEVDHAGWHNAASEILDTIGPGPTIDHGTLSGLADDDHPQYATNADLTTHAGAGDPHPTYMIEGSLYKSVKDFGAAGDGVTDDRQKIIDTIVAAAAAKMGVLFPSPAVAYFISATIDLSAYTGLHFLGLGTTIEDMNGGMPPGARILLASTVNGGFRWDGAGGSAGITFENLGIEGGICSVRFSDGANVRFKNVVTLPYENASADNTGVLLENWFWAWFDDCTFNAQTTAGVPVESKGAVILRGKEPSPNADHCYLINFNNCRWWYNGVYYRDQNDITVNPAHAEAISFTGYHDTENFSSDSSLINFTKTAGTDWAGAGRYVKWLSAVNVSFYDFVGSPAVVRFSVPHGINNAFFANVQAPRLIQRDSGAGGVFRTLVSGVEVTPFVDAAGAPLAAAIIQAGALSSMLDDDLSMGGTITAADTIIANKVSANHDQIDIPDTTAGAGLRIGGTTYPYVALYRAGANVMEVDATLQVKKPFTAQEALGVYVTGDSVTRMMILSEGVLEFGPGNASRDTNLYRSAANVLKTDDALVVAGTIKQSTTKDVLDTDHTAAADPHTGYLLESLLDAKGDIIAASAADTPAKVTVGSNGQVLAADSTETAGVEWRDDFIPAAFSQGGTLAVGTGPFRWYNDTGRTLTIAKVRASVGTAPTGAAILVDVNVDGTTIFSGGTDRPNIAVSTNTDTTTGMSTTTIADGSYLTVDIDQIGSTIPGSDLVVQVWLKG